MVKTIFLKDVLSEMKRQDEYKNPLPFSIKVRTFNLKNKKGGKLLEYKNATLMQPPKKKGAKRLAMDTEFKNPNHFENRTRNLKTENGEIKKIHTIFIDEFNGLKVVF